METIKNILAETPGAVIIPSALTGLGCMILTTIFFVWIIRRRTRKHQLELLNPKGLENVDHGELYDLMDKAKDVKGVSRLIAFLRRKLSESAAQLIEGPVESQEFTEDPGAVPVNEIMKRMRGQSKDDLVEEYSQSLERDKFLRDLDEIIDREELEELRRFAKTPTPKATFYKLVRNRDGLGMWVHVEMRELQDGDVFKTSNDSKNRLWKALSQPYRDHSGILTIHSKQDTENVDTFLMWCRRIMEPKGLHKETENHLKSLFHSKGQYLNGQKRASGRTKATCLYAAYFGKNIEEVGNEDDPDSMPNRTIKKKAVEEFVSCALRAEEWFPGVEKVTSAKV